MSRDVVLELGIDVGSTNTKVALVKIRTGDGWPQVVERSVASGPTPATARALVALVVDLTAQALASTYGSAAFFAAIPPPAPHPAPHHHQECHDPHR